MLPFFPPRLSCCAIFSLHFYAVDRVSFSESSFEAYESDRMLDVKLTRQQSTNSLHNVSVRVRTRDLMAVDFAQGLAYSFILFSDISYLIYH